jgi:hypothetical protein
LLQDATDNIQGTGIITDASLAMPDASPTTNASSPPITDADTSLATNTSPCITDASAITNAVQPLGNIYFKLSYDPLLENADPSAFDPNPFATNLDLMLALKELESMFCAAEPSTWSADVPIDASPDLAQSTHSGTDSIMHLPNPPFHVPFDESVDTSPDLAHSLTHGETTASHQDESINTSSDLAHSKTSVPLTNGETAANDQHKSTNTSPDLAHSNMLAPLPMVRPLLTTKTKVLYLWLKLAQLVISKVGRLRWMLLHLRGYMFVGTMLHSIHESGIMQSVTRPHAVTHQNASTPEMQDPTSTYILLVFKLDSC